MKVYLDDQGDDAVNYPDRLCPEGWILVKTIPATIKLLKSGEVTDLDLDHDLGTPLTGYHVLLWLEAQFCDSKQSYYHIPCPNIKIHSANFGARPKMEQAIQSIYKLKNKGV